MKYKTAQEMRDLDTNAIENYGIPGIVLMENAVIKFMNNIDLEKDNYLIISGTGNNGGDGFGIARQLKLLGKNVKVALIGNPFEIKGDAQTNYNILEKLGIEVSVINDINWDRLEELSEESDVIVDAIFGTGLNSDIKGYLMYVIAIINSSGKIVYSVDLPSGLNADSGKPMGASVQAEKTITFQYMKKGFENEDSKKYTGQVVVESIGIPEI